MAKQADPLVHVRVTPPCSDDWDSTTGNRYRRQLDGTIETASLSHQVRQLKRRATRIAATAFSAACLSLTSTAVAQTISSSSTLPLSDVERAALTKTTRSQSLQPSGPTLVGQILDPVGAAVAGSRIILTNQQTGIEQTIYSNDEGQYLFRSVEAGLYTIQVDQAGFKTTKVEGVALYGDDVKLVNAILQVGDPYVSQPESVGSTYTSEPSLPLVKAARDNDMAALKKLLDAGANVNATDTVYRSSALMMAVSNANLEMVQTLLGAGADVNLKNSRAETALMYLGSEGNVVEVAKALITAGAKLDVQDEDGATALIKLAPFSNREVLQVLLDSAAEVNLKNNNGETALIAAARDDCADNVKALIMAGADVYERDALGKTALTYARERKNTKVIKLLRTFGAIEYSQ